MVAGQVASQLCDGYADLTGEIPSILFPRAFGRVVLEARTGVHLQPARRQPIAQEVRPGISYGLRVARELKDCIASAGKSGSLHRPGENSVYRYFDAGVVSAFRCLGNARIVVANAIATSAHEAVLVHPGRYLLDPEAANLRTVRTGMPEIGHLGTSKRFELNPHFVLPCWVVVVPMLMRALRCRLIRIAIVITMLVVAKLPVGLLRSPDTWRFCEVKLEAS